MGIGTLRSVLEREDGAAADAVFYGSVRPRFVQAAPQRARMQVTGAVSLAARA